MGLRAPSPKQGPVAVCGVTDLQTGRADAHSLPGISRGLWSLPAAEQGQNYTGPCDIGGLPVSTFPREVQKTGAHRERTEACAFMHSVIQSFIH